MIAGLLNSNPYILILGVLIALLGLVFAIIGIIRFSKAGNKMTTRLDQFVLSEVQAPSPTTEEPRIIQREIEGSLFSRTIVNWIRKILEFLGRFAPARLAEDTEHKLIVAGNPANMHAAEFIAVRFLVFIVALGLAVWLNRDIDNLDMLIVVLGLILAIIGLFYPTVWLNGRMRKRQDEIRRALPDALDMLSVCASAGLGFDQSLQKISGYWDTELGREFKRVTQEMEMGISRADALKSMSDRLDVDDLTTFIAILVQAERIGMSYADVLHSQAIQMRIQRQYRAREIINRLPGKIIVPVAVLIFPAMIVVILGPAIPTLLGAFSGL